MLTAQTIAWAQTCWQRRHLLHAVPHLPGGWRAFYISTSSNCLSPGHGPLLPAWRAWGPSRWCGNQSDSILTGFDLVTCHLANVILQKHCHTHSDPCTPGTSTLRVPSNPGSSTDCLAAAMQPTSTICCTIPTTLRGSQDITILSGSLTAPSNCTFLTALSKTRQLLFLTPTDQTA